VSTGDKDLAQLVGPHVTLVNTMSNETLDEAGVRQPFGVPPGASSTTWRSSATPSTTSPASTRSDRRRRSSGCSSTARSTASSPPRPPSAASSATTCARALDFLPLARRLVTVRCDLELPLTLAELRRAPSIASGCSSCSALRDALVAAEVQGERPTARRAPPAATPPPPRRARRRRRAPRGYETILDWPAFERWLQKIGDCASDRARHRNHQPRPLRRPPRRPVAGGRAGRSGVPAARPRLPRRTGATAARSRAGAPAALARSPAHAKIGQNLKYDQHVLANHGIAPRRRRGTTPCSSPTSSNPARTACAGTTSASSRAPPRTADDPLRSALRQGRNQIGFEQVAIDQAAEYAAEDADLCLRLHAAALPADRRRRRPAADLRRDRDAGARRPLPHGAHRRPDRCRAADAAEPRDRQAPARTRGNARTPPPGSRSTSTRRSSSPKSCSTGSACR
jgi:DNA polymerase-1